MIRSESLQGKTVPARPGARIGYFYQRFPEGSIVTDLVARTDRDVTFRTELFRSPRASRPAATGWASGIVDRDDPGPSMARVESASLDRALTHLNISEPPDPRSPAITRNLAVVSEHYATPIMLTGTAYDPYDIEGNSVIRSILTLLTEAEWIGVRRERIARWAYRLQVAPLPLSQLHRIEERLRRWIVLRREHRAGRSPFGHENVEASTLTR